MAGFSTYDGLITAMSAGQRLSSPFSKGNTTAPVAVNWYSMFNVGGQPPAGTWGSTPSGCVSLSGSITGSYFLGTNKSPQTKHLINAIANTTALNGATIVLVDQVAYYPINQSTSNQTFTNVTPPSRYVSAGQPGLQVCLINLEVGGSTASNLTELGYINQNGTSGNIATSPDNAVTVSAAAPTATLGARVLTSTGGPFIPLTTGNSGVRQLTYCTFSAANTGLEAFLLVKPLAYLPCPHIAGVPIERDFVMQVANLERIYDNACLGFLVFFPVATAVTLFGSFDVAWN